MSAEVYARLAAPFDTTHTLPGRGGSGGLTYITGEQCITRLNEVLGPFAWSFVVKEHGHNEAADEIWVLGQLTVNFGNDMVVHEQFGSQEVKHLKNSEEILEIGFDLKGAATDALKKCASMIGVGLYLYRKAGQPASHPPAQQRTQTPPLGTPPIEGDPITTKTLQWFEGNTERAKRAGVDLAPFDLEHMTTEAQAQLVAPRLLAKIQEAERAEKAKSEPVPIR